MKKVFTIIFFLICIVVGCFFVKNVDWNRFLDNIKLQHFYIQRDSEAKFLPDWTSDNLLNKLNEARGKDGLGKFKKNSKLDQAAKARLSVILSEEDVDGAITGLSREKALDNVDYEANLVGDLILVSFFKTNDPISYWKSVVISKNTLNHPDFKEVGIAIKNTEERVDVYVLLVSPRKVVNRVEAPVIDWGGPELWAEINKRRVEMGVNPLKQTNELCTIASIRLNQLLELKKLDGHAGFVPVLQRDDLKWISEKYNISEFLIQGYSTPAEAVKAWEGAMGHRVLLSGGEYVWGCVYAQNTFGVAIAAY